MCEICAQTCNFKISLVIYTDIERRFQNSFTALCNGIISHGTPNCWYLLTTCRNKRKQNMSTIFAHHAAFHACYLHAQMAIQMHLTNPGCFDHRNNPNTPNWSPCWDKYWAGPGISGLYLW